MTVAQNGAAGKGGGGLASVWSQLSPKLPMDCTRRVANSLTKSDRNTNSE
jgi:hypothetical protein